MRRLLEWIEWLIEDHIVGPVSDWIAGRKL